ncbi:S8 family serine peptidase [Lutispora thermophila]|uniref:Subtilase family protein n=1 Tax=Lutispora thermophila DSM 19022 TaxID=1122184 RepID=A0A1M6EUQ9_9FIRM|nr:S8 family serine peptidase [Lutispora thermophila]SHI89099.1 Subtilase family protein [Lutispora thermophila DSM 19022]
MKRFGTFALFIFIILSFTVSLTNPAYGITEDKIRIAIIDTGISSVAISADNLKEGHNYILPNNSTEDDIDHGTAVAGIIVGSEKAGIEGIMPNSRVGAAGLL